VFVDPRFARAAQPRGRARGRRFELDLGLVPLGGRAAGDCSAGLSSITSNSRMLFAFARDGGIPGSAYLSRVSSAFFSPYVAVWISAAGAWAIALWAEAYSAMVALSTLALYSSYALPIALALRARRRGRWMARGPWNLGRWSALVNAIALSWIGAITILFVLPPNQLAGYTFAACLAVLLVYWFGWMNGRFAGPRLGLPTE